MQQRVALARALAIEPRVLLLDEPLSALDAKIRVSLRQEIRSIQRQLGITTVYVTHDQEEALSLSDTVVVMSEGRVEQIGTPSAIYGSPATPVRGPVRGSAQRADCAGTRCGGRPSHHQRPGRRARDARSTGAAAGVAGVGGHPTRGHRAGAGDDDAVQRLVGRRGGHPVPGAGHPCPAAARRRRRHDLLFDTFNRPGTVPPNLGQTITVRLPRQRGIVLDAGRDRRGRGGDT